MCRGSSSAQVPRRFCAFVCFFLVLSSSLPCQGLLVISSNLFCLLPGSGRIVCNALFLHRVRGVFVPLGCVRGRLSAGTRQEQGPGGAQRFPLILSSFKWAFSMMYLDNYPKKPHGNLPHPTHSGWKKETSPLPISSLPLKPTLPTLCSKCIPAGLASPAIISQQLMNLPTLLQAENH